MRKIVKVSEGSVLYILALYPCNARLNQNLYVNNYFTNLLKINNKNK